MALRVLGFNTISLPGNLIRHEANCLIAKSNMSSTSTITATDGSPTSSSTLGNSFGSLRSPRKPHSELSKSYKLASNLFLTRRFPEALSTITPLISLSASESSDLDDAVIPRTAPIAKANRKWRVKIWSFYLTLLNAIAELGPAEGSTTFGANMWRTITVKAEDGSIWQEIVKAGYSGDEAKVDAEVVLNLYKSRSQIVTSADISP